MVLYLSIALSFIVVLLLARRLNIRAGKPSRPPGPPGLPFIGNLLQFQPLDLHLRLATLSNKYGPLMYMKVVTAPTIVISSARVAKEALKDNDLAFSSRPYTSSMAKLSYNSLDISSSPYTEYWREMRKIVVVGLFTNHQVNSFRPARKDEVSRMINEISESTTEVVNLSEAAMSFASSAICRVALGKSYDIEKGSGKRRFDKILEQLQSIYPVFFIGDYYPLLGWIDQLTGKISRLQKVFEDLDSFYQELIDEHLSPNRPQSMDGDVLDILIKLREENSSSIHFDWDNIKAVLMNIFVAGTDTTAATITWAMTALIKKPRVLKKVQGEIRGFIGKKGRVDEDDIEKLSYFKAVVKETLRLYPPAPLSLPRETTISCIVNGYQIEPKTMVFVNLWAIGRDPEFWENPNEFLPERFLNSSIDFRGHDFGFIPFGSGRRHCPGISLGIAEIELAISNLLYSFDWELPHGVTEDDIDTNGAPGTTVHKKNALCLIAKCYE
ncbi:hypothetical protein RD792_009659 [Penstemon davidsonii]|uniref:Cytochrome P450 n=1 Tax=Penstemon davidsonii TaxID=160366 RepID=A0ABR0D0J1_9LAMI|nr:hypothetical protein RD792_009659 [Penstemon davidsonii]